MNSLHPGAVKTEIFRHATFTAIVILKKISFLARHFCKVGVPLKVKKKLVKLIHFLNSQQKTAKEGAQTTIYLAVADDVANVNGQYFSDCKVFRFFWYSIQHRSIDSLFNIFQVAKASELTNDAGLGQKLWEASETLVKLAPEERFLKAV